MFNYFSRMIEIIGSYLFTMCVCIDWSYRSVLLFLLLLLLLLIVYRTTMYRHVRFLYIVSIILHCKYKWMIRLSIVYDWDEKWTMLVDGYCSWWIYFYDCWQHTVLLWIIRVNIRCYFQCATLLECVCAFPLRGKHDYDSYLLPDRFLIEWHVIHFAQEKY
jgi:hypothetical protein